MGYSLYLSTSSDQQLDQGTSAHCSFNRIKPLASGMVGR